ncbi:hypothetical protein D1632_10260 [Chryseobacterium nematophagum]|uniref:Uncharacterized protein n=1 Tax=Chryseobacterium nematophagum TaxID=2305228 RepID=A0A3M7LEQ8_9FLAO|nr:hypothetical protein D1632_10260 [Chryseobacterium nematophagum]
MKYQNTLDLGHLWLFDLKTRSFFNLFNIFADFFFKEGNTTINIFVKVYIKTGFDKIKKINIKSSNV